MRKWIIAIILALCMLPLVSGALQIEISTDNSTWESIESTTYGGVIDEANKIATAPMLNASTTYYIRSKDDGYSWNYTSIETGDAGEVEPLAALAITIFVLAITGIIFLLPYRKGKYYDNVYVDLIIRRAFLTLGFYLMTLNAAIMATIAGFAGIPLTKEMFMFMNLFSWAGYCAMVYMGVKTMIDISGIKKEKKNEERMGNV